MTRVQKLAGLASAGCLIHRDDKSRAIIAALRPDERTSGTISLPCARQLRRLQTVGGACSLVLFSSSVGKGLSRWPLLIERGLRTTIAPAKHRWLPRSLRWRDKGGDNCRPHRQADRSLTSRPSFATGRGRQYGEGRPKDGRVNRSRGTSQCTAGSHGHACSHGVTCGPWHRPAARHASFHPLPGKRVGPQGVVRARRQAMELTGPFAP